MSQNLIHFYQMFAIIFIIILFIAIWSKFIIADRVITVEQKLDRVLDQHNTFYEYAYNNLQKIEQGIKDHNNTRHCLSIEQIMDEVISKNITKETK